MNVWLADGWWTRVNLIRFYFITPFPHTHTNFNMKNQTVECFKLEYVWRRRDKKREFDEDSGVNIKRSIIAFSQASQANIKYTFVVAVVVAVVRFFIGVNRNHLKSQSISTREKIWIWKHEPRVLYTWIFITIAIEWKKPLNLDFTLCEHGCSFGVHYFKFLERFFLHIR